MTIFAPSSYSELSSALYKAVYEEKGPVAVKYPKGSEGFFTDDTFDKDSALLKSGDDLTVVSYGILINTALSAAEMLLKDGVSAEVIKLNRLDKPCLSEVLSSVQKTKRLFVIEDCIEAGSVGEMLSAKCAEKGICAKISLLNFKDGNGGTGTCEQILDGYGISPQKIYDAVKGNAIYE